MKKKKLKTLSLNKQTVVNLNNAEMESIKGGKTKRICWTSNGGAVCIGSDGFQKIDTL